MSRLPLVTTKDLPILVFLSSWFGLMAFVCSYFLPLLILGQPLVSLLASLSFGCSVALMFLITPMSLLRAAMDRLLRCGLTLGVLIGIFSTLYALSLSIINYFLPRSTDTTGILLFIIILICTLGYCPLQRLVNYVVDRVIFVGRPDYYDLFNNLSGQMATSLHLTDLIQLLTVDLPRELRITRIGVMILEQKRSRLYPEGLRFGSNLWSQSRLVALLREGKQFFFCKKVSNDALLSEEFKEIKKAGFSLVYGLQGGSLFAGMLLLGPRQDGSQYTNQDLQAFSTLAHQVSTALENALNFESLENSNRQLQTTFHKLVEAEKMAALGEMTATLAHELINPLSIIRSSAQYLLQEQRDKLTQQKLLNYVVDEVDELNLVINNLLGLARHKPPQFRQVDVRTELNEFVKTWTGCEQHAPQVTIKLDLPDHIPPLYADVKQLRQVLMHCVSNSEEAMEGRGTITLRFREIKQQHVEFCVHDTGPGIAPDALKSAFKKFFTTKERGVGLGLPVCKQIARAHNGSIKLINNEKAGASVILRLPQRPLAVMPLDDTNIGHVP